MTLSECGKPTESTEDVEAVLDLAVVGHTIRIPHPHATLRSLARQGFPSV